MTKRPSTGKSKAPNGKTVNGRAASAASQLRGEALKARIREAVPEHVSQMGDRIDPDRVSMKAIAALVPCSRTTLQKYETVVGDALRDLGYRAARRTGDARAEALAHRADIYKQEIVKLKAELAALHTHHADLYGRLLMASAPMGALVHDDAIAISRHNGRCILCGGTPPREEPINVIDLPASSNRSTKGKKP